MPYVVTKKNGKRQRTPFVFTAVEIENLRRRAGGDCFTVVNTTTRKVSQVGACRAKRRSRRSPAKLGCGCGG